MSEESKDAIVAIVIAVSLNITVGAFWVIQILKGFGERLSRELAIRIQQPIMALPKFVFILSNLPLRFFRKAPGVHARDHKVQWARGVLQSNSIDQWLL